MNLEIDRLRLHLPAGFEQRGQRIAQLVGRELAHLKMSGSCRIEQLQIGPLHLPASPTDASVARQIAHAIAAQVAASSRNTCDA